MALNKWTDFRSADGPITHAATIEFENWTEMLEFADKAPSTFPGRDSRMNTDERWAGTKNWEACVALAHKGWIDGAAAASKFYLGTVEKISSLIEVQTPYYDLEGWTFDVSRYIEDEPEHWVQYHTDYRSGVGRVIKVLVNNCASAVVGVDVIRRRGAALSALVQLLEFSGRPVELVATFAVGNDTYNAPRRVESTVVVKRAGQPLDLPRVAFAMGHPSMLRRVQFSLWETSPTFYHKSGYQGGVLGPNYGIPQVTLHKGDIMVERMLGYEAPWASDEAAEQFVLKELAAQGVRLKRQE